MGGSGLTPLTMPDVVDAPGLSEERVYRPDSASASVFSGESRERVLDAAAGEHDRITAAFQSLPKGWRAVLWHADVVGEPVHGIGALMNLEPEAVATMLTVAREGLQSAYQALLIR